MQLVVKMDIMAMVENLAAQVQINVVRHKFYFYFVDLSNEVLFSVFPRFNLINQILKYITPTLGFSYAFSSRSSKPYQIQRGMFLFTLLSRID